MQLLENKVIRLVEEREDTINDKPIEIIDPNIELNLN